MFCNQGWQCPKCQKIWSPSTTGCNNCNSGWTGGFGPATSGSWPDLRFPFVSGFQVVDPIVKFDPPPPPPPPKPRGWREGIGPVNEE